MAVLEVVFEVPKWVEAGVRSGELHVFGGVVRDSAGQIVLHLREAIRKPQNELGKYSLAVIVGAAVGAAVGFAGYHLHRRLSRKGRALAALESVDSTMSAYLVSAQQHCLTIADVEALSAALTSFLEMWRRPEFRDVQIKVSSEVYMRLHDFLRSVRSFNQAAHAQLPVLPNPPAVVADGSSLDSLLDELLEHVRYQEAALDVVRAT